MTEALSLEKSHDSALEQQQQQQQQTTPTSAIDTPDTTFPLEKQQPHDIENASNEKDADATPSNPPPLTGTRVALLFLG